MDKGSNEAEKGEVARDRRGQGGGRRRGRRQRTVGVERRRGKKGNVPHCQLFLTLRLCFYAKQRQHESDGGEECGIEGEKTQALKRR